MLQKMTNVTELFGIKKPEELLSVFDKIQVHAYKAGEMVFIPGESTCERIYILKEGEVDLYQITSNGKRLVIGHLMPGTVFGVRGVLSRARQRNFAEAVQDSVSYVITKEQFLAYLKRNPEVTIRMLEAGYECLYVAEERLMKSSYSPVKVRIAYFLLSNSDPASGLISNFTHEEIGNSIGAIRETVTDVLNIMRVEGLVHLGRKQIQLVDRKRLTAILGGWEN